MLKNRKVTRKLTSFLVCLIFLAIKSTSLSGGELSESEMDKLRLKQISPVPTINADYKFGIDKILPGWEGMKGARTLKDYFGAGNDAFEVRHGTAANLFWSGHVVYWYWPLKNIEKGKYFIGLWVETGCDPMRTEFTPTSLMATVYLNGWPVRFSTTSDPAQVRPGIWLAELQSEEAVKIKDGDEIAVCPANGMQIGDSKKIFRLALYKKEPKRGHGVTGQTFSIYSGVPQRVRLALNAKIIGSGNDGAKHTARIEIANPLPYPVETDVTWKLADYYGKPLDGKVERIKLAPHKATEIEKEFIASGESKAYQLDVKSKPAPDFKFPVERPVELLELNDYSRIEFLPNQPDPLTVWSQDRKDIVDKHSGFEKVFPLSDLGWEEAPGDGLKAQDSVPGNLDFKPCKRGYRGRRLPKKSSARWYRKKFTAPNWAHGEKYIFKIKDKASETTLFVNGQIAGRLIGYKTLKEFDVSKFIRPEKENEITIFLRGPVAMVNPDFIPEYDKSDENKVEENLDFPTNYRSSKPDLKSVVLLACPSLNISQSLVITDLERQTLRVFTRVANMDDCDHDAVLKFKLFQKGENIPIDAPERKISLKGGEKKEFMTEIQLGESFLSSLADIFSSKERTKLNPYTPKNPIMAKLSTQLFEDGKKIDVFNQRFGYRTVKVEGAEITFNGHPINFLGGCFCPKSFFLEGESGTDTDRRYYEKKHPKGIDSADELGIMSYPSNILDDTQSWKILNNDKYWERMADWQLELTWRYGSHPSVFGWDISNESYHYAALHHLGRDSVIRHGERIASLAEDVWKKVWPDYFFLADGDRSLGDRINFCSFHYLNYSLGHGYFRHNPEKPYRRIPEGVSSYPPDCHFLNNAKNILPKGAMIGGKPQTEKDWEYGSSPSGDTETIWFTNRANATASSLYIGDKASVSTNYLFQTARGMFFAKELLEGLRDLEQSLIVPCGWQDFYNQIWQDVAFAMPEKQIRYYSGSKFDRRINIHDDEFKPGNLEFTWKLIDPMGKTVLQDNIKAESDTAFLKRDRVSFDVPEVNERTKFQLVMELWKDGKKRAYEDRILEVWPLSAKKLSGKAPMEKLTVYDPNNALTPILKKMGYAVKSVSALDKKSLDGLKCIIIGPDCVTEKMLASGQPIHSFVETGGRVILMRQKEDALKELGVKLKKRAWYSIGFVRIPEHPVMQGLEDMDFQMWNPDHVMSKGNYIKPNKGAYLALVDAGCQATMAWTPFLELYIGKGSILATQFLLAEGFETEPMCAEILKRSIAYFDAPLFRSPNKQLALLTGASDPVLKRLKKVRADFKEIAKPDSKYSVTLLDLNSSAGLPDAKTLRRYMEEGGTLIAHRAKPDNRVFLQELAGKPVKIQAQPYRAWVDRQMLDRRDGLATGLNNLDLYWRALSAGCRWDSKMQISCAPEYGRGQVQYVVDVEGVEDYIFPGGLLEIPIGKGRLIVNQLKWEMPDREMLCGSPSRVISNLLTNLEIKRSLPRAKVTMPRNVSYETIDVTPYANLSVVDEKAGDGKGWCDWGPSQVLGAFPTGKTRKFNGVPFSLPRGENNAIALRVKQEWLPSLADYPEEIVIPINKSNVAGLWFLHTGGWIKDSGALAYRIIEYADGSREQISIDSSNAADWNYGRDAFPNEEGTLTLVAWRGKCKKNPVTRVYQTYWPNPHPNKEIKRVTLSNSGFKKKSFTPTLGITVAKNANKTKTSTPENRSAKDTVKSQNLFKKALSLIEVGKEKAAEQKLNEAIAADSQNSGAWTTLCELRAKKDDLKTFIKLCNKWMELVPDNFHAHNVLGKYFEDRNMLQEALIEYRKSHAIEWNQPPIGNAIKRIQKKLNEKKKKN